MPPKPSCCSLNRHLPVLVTCAVRPVRNNHNKRSGSVSRSLCIQLSVETRYQLIQNLHLSPYKCWKDQDMIDSSEIRDSTNFIDEMHYNPQSVVEYVSKISPNEFFAEVGD